MGCLHACACAQWVCTPMRALVHGGRSRPLRPGFLLLSGAWSPRECLSFGFTGLVILLLGLGSRPKDLLAVEIKRLQRVCAARWDTESQEAFHRLVAFQVPQCSLGSQSASQIAPLHCSTHRPTRGLRAPAVPRSQMGWDGQLVQHHPSWSRGVGFTL